MNTVEYNLNGKRYRLASDLHTHTRFSHGKGSIEDNVMAARGKGVMKIGISDHGYGHFVFGLTRKDTKLMRAETDRLGKAFPDMEILLGIEANIIAGSGNLDMKQEDFADFDYVIAGYHYGATGLNLVGNGMMTVENALFAHTGISSARLMRRNTDNMVNALESFHIDIVSHPWHKVDLDLLEIAVVCARRGTMIEINSGHLDTLTEEDLKTMALTDVKFILTSDAHTPGRVGDFAAGLTKFLAAGLDIGRITNIEAVT